MSARILSLSVVAFLIGVAVPVALALTPPQWIDDEFRTCTGDAINREWEDRIQAQREFNDKQIQDQEIYRDDLRRAWQITIEADRKNEIREADRRYRDNSRESSREYSDRIRDIRNESRDAQKTCRNEFNDHKRFVKSMCLSTNDCRANQICTTERGVCEQSCPEGADTCIQVCAGTCERTSSSRSSSSRSSSSSSNIFGGGFSSFGTNSSSNSTSSTGVGGINCQPYTCPDGRQVPACDSGGNFIDYQSNPCYS